jgi:hypothetical protein
MGSLDCSATFSYCICQKARSLRKSDYADYSFHCTTRKNYNIVFATDYIVAQPLSYIDIHHSASLRSVQIMYPTKRVESIVQEYQTLIETGSVDQSRTKGRRKNNTGHDYHKNENSEYVDHDYDEDDDGDYITDDSEQDSEEEDNENDDELEEDSVESSGGESGEDSEEEDNENDDELEEDSGESSEGESREGVEEVDEGYDDGISMSTKRSFRLSSQPPNHPRRIVTGQLSDTKQAD